ncbi:MAG: hypothetical protein SGPRY_009808, partial [Prymnesium sp.]
MYDIYDASNGVHLFTILEQSEDFERCCCAPNHNLVAEWKGVYGMGDLSKAPREQLSALPSVMYAEREGCCSKWGLGCCVFHEACQQQMFVHAGAPQPGIKPGSIKNSSSSWMGYIEQPVPFGGTFTPTLNVMERDSPAGDTLRPIAKIEGPWMFGGWCVRVWKKGCGGWRPDNLGMKLRVGDMAKITKKKPSSFSSLAREAFTDSDTFTLEFDESANLAPQQKAMMMASLVLVDYMFFEQDNGQCSCDGNQLKITLCECYFLGSTCPCNININASQGGGGAPSTGE